MLHVVGEVGEEAGAISEVVRQGGQPEAVDGEVGGLSIMAPVELMVGQPHAQFGDDEDQGGDFVRELLTWEAGGVAG